MGASSLFTISQPIIDSDRSIFASLQANHPLCTDMRVMNNARRQIEPVTGLQGQLLAKLRQAEGNTSSHNVDHFVVGMRVRRIRVKGPV